MMFGLAPRWVKQVQEKGVAATAVLLTNPQDKLKKYQQGYQGRDKWLALPVRVQAQDGTTYTSDMQCQMSQILFGLMKAEMQVNVKYDPQNKERVVLVDDVQKLLSYRVKG
ncbi:MAG: hypothetical protein H6658_16070 [Ardenticatenaceae bacterium]|nr:hypothetical protein [Ardenticatenaceae bacterium]